MATARGSTSERSGRSRLLLILLGALALAPRSVVAADPTGTPGQPRLSDAAAPPEVRILSPDVQICGAAAIRPAPGRFPSCVPTISRADLGKVRAVWLSAEGAIASSSPKAPEITAGGKSLVYRRADGTSAPPACGAIGASPPCFTYEDGLDKVNTCYLPSAPASRRGQEVGLNLAAEIADIKSAAAAERPGASPPITILAYRFDLITWPEMEIAGFDPSWLLTAGTPWSQFQSWITNDRSDSCKTTNADCSGPGIGRNGARVACCVGRNPNAANYCTGACSWTWSHRGWSADWDGRDLGIRLNDEIKALGRDPETVTYYLTRPPNQRISPDAAIVRQDIAAYQDWRIAQVKRLLEETGADMIHLNHKLHQFDRRQHGGSFYVGDRYPNVSAMIAAGDGGFSANQVGAGYGLAQYVAGWRALATKLHQQGLRYQVWFNGYVWQDERVDDDPSTPAVNENAVIRSVVYDADLVFVDREGPWPKLVSELEARHVPYILLDVNCAHP